MRQVEVSGSSDQLDFTGRTVVITGAGRGVGRAHALAFARRGAAVLVNDLGAGATGDGESDGRVADAVVAEICASGGRAVADHTDVALAGAGERIVDRALEHFGRIDVLIANAGIDAIVDMAAITPELLDRFFTVHAFGTLSLVTAAWPHLVEQRYGRIVTTTSAAGFFGLPRALPYAMAKGAVNALTQTLAADGVRHGITVNSIGPFAASRLAAARTSDRPALLDAIERFAPASAIPPVALWLAHESTEVTGRVFEVGAQAVAQIVIGQAEGIWATELTPETVRDNAALLLSTEAVQPLGPVGMTRPVMRHIASRTS